MYNNSHEPFRMCITIIFPRGTVEKVSPAVLVLLHNSPLRVNFVELTYLIAVARRVLVSEIIYKVLDSFNQSDLFYLVL